MSGVYRYDGTFEGFLTLMARLLPDRIMPAAIHVELPYQQALFGEPTTVATDPAMADAFAQELVRGLTPSCFGQVRRAFLADDREREIVICRFLLLAREVGSGVVGMLAHPAVAPLWKLAQQVGREAHRYKGFVRFQEVKEGFFYAAVAPDHRILRLVAPHFASRFADQHWVIHDTKHDEGIVHDRERRQWLHIPMERQGKPDPTAAEERFQTWWRTWFGALAIPERENRRLQQSKVPLKVRPWLVEF